MDDDKDKTGGDASKRAPPTIDLAASEVTDSPRASGVSDVNETASDHSESTADPAPESQAEKSQPRHIDGDYTQIQRIQSHS